MAPQSPTTNDRFRCATVATRADQLGAEERPALANLEQLFDESPDAQLLWDPRDDAILAANQCACAILGRERAMLLATPVSALHEGERGALVVFTQAILERGEYWTNSLSCVLPGGSRLAIEYLARRIEAAAVGLDSGSLILATARDLHTVRRRELHADAQAYVRSGLSEWRRVERLFADIESDNQLILRAAGEGIYGVDGDGVTTFVNPAAAQMLGFDAHELVGRNMHSTIHHSRSGGVEYPAEECPIYRAFREGAVHRRDDEVFWRKDGTSFPVDYTSTPVVDRGRIVGAVVVFRDISEHRDDEHRLRTAMAELEQLKRRLELENDYLQQELIEEGNYREIVGLSQAIRNVVRKIELVAPTEAPVLITGESGTGKELIARAIHGAGKRSERPLIRVNCAAVPADLFESEFFGHVRGAFTSAIADRVGRFELADQGTLFLDEIGEIPLELQGKLLRVLQEGQFERVGDTRTRNVDVRVVAATNRRLDEEVAAGRFREDLFYRLNVFPIESVPLRECPEDIPLLAVNFLAKISRRHRREVLQLTRADVERLQAYHWPGNVRELENLIERALIVSTGNKLVIDLPAGPAQGACSPSSARESGSAGDAPPKTESERRAQERAMIVSALEASGGKVFGAGGAAEMLGLKPTTLASRIKRLGISKPPRGSGAAR
ncbi:MAG: sigma 54-interacting transcriptional regulator [Thiohalocapsa sp.]